MRNSYSSIPSAPASRSLRTTVLSILANVFASAIEPAVVAIASLEDVEIRTAFETVIVTAAKQGVAAGAAEQVVLPRVTEKQIVARTGGVPLFIEEITRMLLDSNLLAEEGDRYVLAGPLPSSVKCVWRVAAQLGMMATALLAACDG